MTMGNSAGTDSRSPSRSGSGGLADVAYAGGLIASQLRGAHQILLAVCAVFAVLPALLVPLNLPLGWDELVYAGRFATYTHGLDVPFEAPRTRGVPVLIAPVAAWTDSVVLLRVWLSLLAGVALYLGFLPWLRVFRARPYVVPLAAAGYGSLWFALFYVGSAMPNHYTAMGATAAVGCFLRCVDGACGGGERRGLRPRMLCGLALGIGVATLMRPNDAVWIAGPLILAVLLYRPCRSAAPLVAIAVGGLVAALPWVVESELRFGGVAERLALATDQQGGVGLRFNLLAVIDALDGPLLCRPCAAVGTALPVGWWWYALPFLVGGGLWVALRGRVGRIDRRTTEVRGGTEAIPVAAVVLPTVVAGSAAVTYLFLIDYGAARFLFTSYALLALPAAVAVRALWGVAVAARGFGRGSAVVLSLVLVGHLGVQLATVRGHADIQSDARRDWTRITAALREAGVGRGCVLDGNSMVIPVAYTAGCLSAAQRPERTPDALVLRNAQLPYAQRDWRVIPVRGTYNQGWRIAVPAP